jgi:hypothetical protein
MVPSIHPTPIVRPIQRRRQHSGVVHSNRPSIRDECQTPGATANTSRAHFPACDTPSSISAQRAPEKLDDGFSGSLALDSQPTIAPNSEPRLAVSSTGWRQIRMSYRVPARKTDRDNKARNCRSVGVAVVGVRFRPGTTADFVPPIWISNESWPHTLSSSRPADFGKRGHNLDIPIQHCGNYVLWPP